MPTPRRTSKTTTTPTSSSSPAAETKTPVITETAVAAPEPVAPPPAPAPATPAPPVVVVAGTAVETPAPAPEKSSKARKDSKKASKPAKVKMVRDSFTMPESDYALLAQLKQRCLSQGVAVKKSELLRLGLQALNALPEATLLEQVSQLEKLKTGRPAK